MKNIFLSIKIIVFYFSITIFLLSFFVFNSDSSNNENMFYHVIITVSLIGVLFVTFFGLYVDKRDYDKETKELIDNFKSINSTLKKHELKIEKMELQMKDLILHGYKNMNPLEFLTLIKDNFENNLPDIEYWDDFVEVLVDRILKGEFDEYIEKPFAGGKWKTDKSKLSLSIRIDNFDIRFFVYKNELHLSIRSYIDEDLENTKDYYKTYEGDELIDKLYNKLIGFLDNQEYKNE